MTHPVHIIDTLTARRRKDLGVPVDGDPPLVPGDLQLHLVPLAVVELVPADGEQDCQQAQTRRGRFYFHMCCFFNQSCRH